MDHRRSPKSPTGRGRRSAALAALLMLAVMPQASKAGQHGDEPSACAAKLDTTDEMAYASLASVGRQDEEFGTAVAVEESWAVVGAPRDPGMTANQLNDTLSNDGAQDFADDLLASAVQDGAVMVYNRGGGLHGKWRKHVRLIPSDHESTASEQCRASRAAMEMVTTIGAAVPALVVRTAVEQHVIKAMFGAFSFCMDMGGAGPRLYLVGDELQVHQAGASAKVEQLTPEQRDALLDNTTEEDIKVWISQSLTEENSGEGSEAMLKAVRQKSGVHLGVCKLLTGIAQFATLNVLPAYMWYALRNLIMPWNHQEITPCGSRFGSAVAIKGGRVLVGAPFFTDPAVPGGGEYTGAAYVFTLQRDGSFVQTAKLTAQVPKERSLFGSAVGINGDIIAIGARGFCSSGCAGSVHIFRRSGSSWVPETMLTPSHLGAPESSPGDMFGLSLSLSSGGRLVVGATGANAIGAKATGAAYIFDRTDGWFSDPEWTQAARLVPENSGNIGFGHSVAVDADTVMVGAVDPTGASDMTGAVYAYSNDGGTWDKQQQLDSPTAPGAMFGSSIAVVGDYAIVGAAGMDQPSVPYQSGLYGMLGLRQSMSGVGAGWMYHKRSNRWQTVPKPRLDPTCPLTEAGAQFGSSVALTGCAFGLTALVGVPYDVSGSVYVFETPRPSHWSKFVMSVSGLFGSKPQAGVAELTDTFRYERQTGTLSATVSQLLAGYLSKTTPVAGPDQAQEFAERDVDFQMSSRREAVTVTLMIPTYGEGPARAVLEGLPVFLSSAEFAAELNAISLLGNVTMTLHTVEIVATADSGSSSTSSALIVLAVLAVLLVLVLAVLVVGGLYYIWKQETAPAHHAAPTPPEMEMSPNNSIIVGTLVSNIDVDVNPIHEEEKKPLTPKNEIQVLKASYAKE